MPEYLAPGVYVEETSFRAKSIEGVSTSTTAFVGPTRRGPVGDANEIPELLTSFPDFERIYGGLAGIHGQPNYMAHAVRAYFNEGGSRLYVSRVFLPNGDGGYASSDAVVAAGEAAGQARFVARFPGSAGNGAITLRQVETPATVGTMASAPEGTLLRTGGDSPAAPARVQAGMAPFRLRDGEELRLRVGGEDVTVAFRGQSAEVTASDALAATVELTAENGTLQVTINGTAQPVTLPAGEYDRDELVAEINTRLRGGYARLTGGAEGERDRLVVGTEREGSGASVQVGANPAFGFGAAATAANTADANNNVADLGNVTADELNALLEPNGVRATLSPTTGQVVLSTTRSGDDATLEVRGGESSAHGAIGVALTPEPVRGRTGPELRYYVRRGSSWTAENGAPLQLGGLRPEQAPEGGADFLTIRVVAQDADRNQNVFEGLGFDRVHPRWIGAAMAERPQRRAEHLEHIFAFRIGADVTAFALQRGLFAGGDARTVVLTGGSDGLTPTQAAYEQALGSLEALDDVSIVAGPGHTAYPADWQGIQGAIIAHASGERAYRIAVLDTPPGQIPGDARRTRSLIDSKYAAIYYPWVTVANPLARPGVESVPREINLPPSGFVCGIYARNDVERGVHKAPANEVVRGAIRFEVDVNARQQAMLNPIGVNCLRFFPGRGFRIWGARVASSDPEWKYVNVRRYFLYLERSVDVGTQWAVFEPNGERLWANVRETVSSFLYNEWRNGALLGSSQKEAYFVRCDRSTMTQNDLDNGRLICLVGVAVVKPAEFVVFRIGQKTADARD